MIKIYKRNRLAFLFRTKEVLKFVEGKTLFCILVCLKVDEQKYKTERRKERRQQWSEVRHIRRLIKLTFTLYYGSHIHEKRNLTNNIMKALHLTMHL